MSAFTTLSGTPAMSGADVYANSSVQQMSLGAYMETPDGRGFRYAKVGAVATVAGKVYQGKALDATNAQVSGGFAVAAAAIGDTSITTTATMTLSANDYADGFLSVAVTPGQGYTYKIKSHAAASAAAVTMNLYDPVIVALTTSSRVIWVAHPYKGIVIEPGTPTANIAGVAPGIVTAAYFGWVQTRGPAAVLFTGTGVAGKAVGSLSGGTSGSAAPAIAATNIIGYHMATGITGEYSMVYLTLN
jgi:hypothetical protein